MLLAGIVVAHHDLTGIVVRVTALGTARDLGRYDSRLKWKGGQGTLLSTCNPAWIAGVQRVGNNDGEFCPEETSMANGTKGDHPVTDILHYREANFSPKADNLVREIAEYVSN